MSMHDVAAWAENLFDPGSGFGDAHCCRKCPETDCIRVNSSCDVLWYRQWVFWVASSSIYWRSTNFLECQPNKLSFTGNIFRRSQNWVRLWHRHRERRRHCDLPSLVTHVLAAWDSSVQAGGGSQCPRHWINILPAHTLSLRPHDNCLSSPFSEKWDECS